MTIKDRGTKKWTSFFMPEQVNLIRKLYEEDEYKVKPVLDEQELKEINTNLHYAIHQDLEIEITYFANHDYQKIKGKIDSIDMHTRSVRLENEERLKINFEDILHISLD